MHYEALKQVWGALIAPGAPFEVETIEVRGAPILTFKNAAPNIRALWLSTAAFGDRDYLIYQDERITYAEAHRRVASNASSPTLKAYSMVSLRVNDRSRIGLPNPDAPMIW